MGSDVISSAEEFVALQKSSDLKQHHRIWTDSAPEEVWLEILQRHPEMKTWVAQNLTIPEPVVRRLAADRDPALRLVIARRKTLPEGAFDDLSRDPDGNVREAIAWNPWTPPAIRTRLTADPDPRVSRMAKEIAARHEDASALRRAIPKIPGLAVDLSDPGKVAVVMDDDASLASFQKLLSWLPTGCSLHFWDADYPSPSDPGAYFIVQKLGSAWIWRMGNHGWSGDWRATSADEVVARLAANRRDERGGPARIGIEKAWPTAGRRVQARGKAKPEPKRPAGLAAWIFALIALAAMLWGVVTLMDVGVDFVRPW